MSDTASGPSEAVDGPVTASLWTYVWTLLGGLLLGLVGGFLQAVDVTIGSLSVPIWAVVVLAAMVVTTRAITTVYGSRKPAFSWFLGWMVATLLLALTLPGGDQVISDGAVQMFYLFGGVVIGSAVASLPAQMRPAQSPQPGLAGVSADDHRAESEFEPAGSHEPANGGESSSRSESSGESRSSSGSERLGDPDA